MRELTGQASARFEEQRRGGHDGAGRDSNEIPSTEPPTNSKHAGIDRNGPPARVSPALVRWAHPQRGLILRDEFIPLAENTGLIRLLTRWVLNEALRQCRELLSCWQVMPGRLKLEISESTVMADAERTLDMLGRLREMGVQLAIDDFGTGYLSLSYLKRMPVDELELRAA
jgi:EAL domain-containing protein (putative c-di-GMP-specific phosphodiesterase class I)